MENHDDSWNNLATPATEILSSEVTEIRLQRAKIELTAEEIVKRTRYRKYYTIGGIILIILLPFIIYFSLPKQSPPFYEKNEEFGPCLTGKEHCYQIIKIYLNGDVVYSGKENKTFEISIANVRKIKKLITDSKLMTQSCEETPILMEYSLTHTFNLNGKTKTIESPACEDELETLDNSIKDYLQ